MAEVGEKRKRREANWPTGQPASWPDKNGEQRFLLLTDRPVRQLAPRQRFV
jgi:hypothetical protein